MALLGWDEETYMPSAGAAHRGNQAALLAGIAHEKLTDASFGDTINELLLHSKENLPEGASAQLLHAKRLHDRGCRLPRKLVEEQRRIAALSQQAWLEARQEKRFSVLEPYLERVISLKREEAAAIAINGLSTWEVLVDEYEPGAREDHILPLLDELKNNLKPLIQIAADSTNTPSRNVFCRQYDVRKQRQLFETVAVKLGYDMGAGRIDLTTHPFCTTIAGKDVRIAIGISESDIGDGLFSVIHEVGHALYEQGIPEDLVGTPAGELRSFSLHESQSRLWENLVARSRPFWNFLHPEIQRMFPGTVDDVSAEEMFLAANSISPGPVRVYADEATYNLHISIRTDLERALIRGDLSVHDLPAAWNHAYSSTLGVTVKNDLEGCLQDTHWPAGLFGYFPTYALGNIYAAHLWKAVRSELPSLDTDIESGSFSSLLHWLRQNVHVHASTKSVTDIIEGATGQKPSSHAFIEHLQARFCELGIM